MNSTAWVNARTTRQVSPGPAQPGLLRRPAAPTPAPAPGSARPEFGHSFAQVQVHAPAVIQPKLTIGQPGDDYEREADAIARQVAQHQDGANPTAPTPVSVQRRLQRQLTSNPPDMEEKLREEQGLQRKGDGAAPATPPLLEQRLSARAGAGQPLPGPTRARMEASFGASFDRVRVHTDGEAAQLSRQVQAEAFTYGNDIYFGAGRYDDRTRRGTELLAHELTHTLQQEGLRRKALQCRGGTKVGELSVRSNVISAGLTAGHAWLSYTPVGGSETTYGTWGNRTPIGLHRNLEVGASAAAIRTTDLDSGDHSALGSFASANNAWGYINNCASFAARGWSAITGEALDYTTFGIPNPSALGAGIVAANGGPTGVLATTPVAAPTPSSGGSSL